MCDKREEPRSAAIQAEINTIAFIDIETTNLEENSDIWQLCIVAFKAIDFLGEMPLKELARFIRFYNPPSEIHPDVIRLTGMTNQKLKDCPPIDDFAKNELKDFFDKVAAPICLVAHYGIKFDFPLLKRHFSGSVPSSVKVVDSIDLFRHHQSMFTPSSRISFKLKEVYKRFFKDEPIVQHEAEHDVQTLIRCILHIAKCPRMLHYGEHLLKCLNIYCKSYATIDRWKSKSLASLSDDPNAQAPVKRKTTLNDYFSVNQTSSIAPQTPVLEIVPKLKVSQRTAEEQNILKDIDQFMEWAG